MTHRGAMPLRDRLAAIQEECGTPLGFAMRGVTSWEQQRLDQWMARDPLHLEPHEWLELQRIEAQVFGVSQ